MLSNKLDILLFWVFSLGIPTQTLGLGSDLYIILQAFPENMSWFLCTFRKKWKTKSLGIKKEQREQWEEGRRLHKLVQERMAQNKHWLIARKNAIVKTVLCYL